MPGSVLEPRETRKGSIARRSAAPQRKRLRVRDTLASRGTSSAVRTSPKSHNRRSTAVEYRAPRSASDWESGRRRRRHNGIFAARFDGNDRHRRRRGRAVRGLGGAITRALTQKTFETRWPKSARRVNRNRGLRLVGLPIACEFISRTEASLATMLFKYV